MERPTRASAHRQLHTDDGEGGWCTWAALPGLGEACRRDGAVVVGVERRVEALWEQSESGGVEAKCERLSLLGLALLLKVVETGGRSKDSVGNQGASKDDDGHCLKAGAWSERGR
jgi:hypothetical protein